MALLADAMELPAGERDGFVSNRCDPNSTILVEARRLLSRADSADRMLSPEVRGRMISVAQSAASAHPEQIGPYRIRRKIGEGGMGRVYEAEQVSPRRRVAIKAIRFGLETGAMRRRFEYEAQILGQLEHPGIARLYESQIGVGDGSMQAYLVMELVEGKPIDEYARSGALDARGKIRLVIKVCEAIEYAHRIGVIHRDLKPANILVDADGQPKVLDFGVAKAIGVDIEAPFRTQAGQIIGTLAYLSPERVESTHPVDTRSDVYSLGVILYELLVGQLPIDVSNLSVVSAVHRICSESPKMLGTIDRSLRGDIEVVIARAIDKDPSRRYPSAEAFARDLQRFLEGRPVEARSDSRLYVLRTIAWRFRGSIALAAASLCILCAFTIYSWHLARSNERQATELRRLLYVSDVGFAHAALVNNDVPRLHALLDSCPPDMRGWEYSYLRHEADQSLQTRKLPFELIRYADRSADHRLVACAALPNQVFLLDTDTGAIRFERKLAEPWARVAINPKGTTLAFGAYSDALTLYELDGSKPEIPLVQSAADGASTYSRRARTICFSPDGSKLATVNLFGRVYTYDVATQNLIGQFDVGPREPQALLFTADSNSLIVSNDRGKMTRRDPVTGAAQIDYVGHEASIGCLSLSADGKTLISGDFIGEVAMWSVETGQRLLHVRMDNQWITGVALSADNKTLAVGRADAGLFLFDVASQYPRCQLHGHTRGVVQIWYDSDTITSVGLDSEIRTWLAEPDLNSSTIASGQINTLGLAFMPDSGSLFSAGTDGTVRRWDVHTLKQLQSFERHEQTVYYVALDKAGRTLASASRDKRIKLWDVASGRLLRTFVSERGHALSVALSPDGTKMLSGDVEGGIQLWDVASGQQLKSWQLDGRVVYSLTFHPDGVHFACAAGDGKARLYELSGNNPLDTVVIDKAIAYEVRFSNDGLKLAAVGGNGAAAIYDVTGLRSMRLIRRFIGHVAIVTGVAVHPDGSRLATCGADRTIRIWDIATGTELMTLRGHSNLIQRLAFSPDGRMLASTSDDGTVKLWRTTP